MPAFFEGEDLNMVKEFSTFEYDWLYILPSLEYKHKAWYIWQFMFSWLKWSFSMEIIDTKERDIVTSSSK